MKLCLSVSEVCNVRVFKDFSSFCTKGGHNVIRKLSLIKKILFPRKEENLYFVGVLGTFWPFSEITWDF